MSPTDTDTDTDTDTETKTDEELPPYSGEDALCPMCSDTEPYTRYRPKITGYKVIEYNGRNRFSPLPECLERQCRRCDYQWDEALNPPPPAPEPELPQVADVQDVARVLDIALRRWGTALPSDDVRLVAGTIKEALYTDRRPEHSIWSPGSIANDRLITLPPKTTPADAAPVLPDTAPARPDTLRRQETPDGDHAPGGDR